MAQPELTKGKSPFYPGQPVPLELFVGRKQQIDRIVERGIKQTAAGKSVSFFIEGEYGIGKSSIARYLLGVAELKHGLHGIYANLGGAETLEDLSAAIVSATLQSGVFNPTRGEVVKNWLAKYIGQQSLFGLTLNVDALKQDVATLASPFGMYQFLASAKGRLSESGVKGIVLVLDEINGISGNPKFAHFLKGLVEQNATSKEPVPLLLLLCGVEERRREMIAHHEPVARVFDVVQIERMNDAEMEEFFTRAFASVKMSVEEAAMWLMCHHSAGFPKVMHTVGDAAYWQDKDGRVDFDDAMSAVFAAAEEIGKKYVDQQVISALQSKDYRSILNKLAQTGPPDGVTFLKGDVEKDLTESEKKKLNNFLQKMKELNVLRSGEVRGEYVFNLRMVKLYIWLRAIAEKPPKPQQETK